MNMSDTWCETDRLSLRPFTQDDLDAYTARIYADPDVMRYLPKRDVLPRERAQKSIEYFTQHWEQFGYGVWAVVEKASGVLMGQCGLNHIGELNETELLYAYAKKYWRQGYGIEAARASVVYGFEQVGLERLIALAVHENTGSRRIMELCGMKYEKDVQLWGLNLAYYALNRTEWSLSTNNTNRTN